MAVLDIILSSARKVNLLKKVYFQESQKTKPILMEHDRTVTRKVLSSWPIFNLLL